MTNEELAVRARNGDQYAKADLWAQVKRYCRAQAIKWVNALHGAGGTYDRREAIEDGTQAGAVAMLEAVKRYEPSKGAFLTWMDYFLIGELSDTFGLRTEHRKKDPLNLAQTRSLDAPLDDEDPDGGTLHDVIPDPEINVAETVERRALRLILDNALADLEPREADAIRAIYLNGQSETDYAAKIGKSVSTVSANNKNSFRKLRNDPVLRDTFDEGFNYYKGGNVDESIEEKYLIHKEHWESIRRRAKR